jgi:hypothetical protein
MKCHFTVEGCEIESDFNFLILFYKQYSGFLVKQLLMIFRNLYFCDTFRKKKYKVTIRLSTKVFLIVYLVGVGLLLNLDEVSSRNH